MGKARLSEIRREAFLPYCQPSIGEEEIREVVDTLKSGWLTTGPRVKKFEQLLAEYTGAKYAIALNSCTAALHLSLVALGIGKGDEVVTTPFTFPATGNVIVHVGAKPVLVDIKPDTYNIDPEDVNKAVTPETKAIIPVHYAGQPCDMKAIMEIAEDQNLYVIEDAAHALGAEYEGKKVGTFGHSTCFSFYATKNITTGEGGAVTTDSKELADKLRVLRLHGMSKDAWKRYSSKGSWYYELKECGFKENMTDVQAALGIHQIKKLDKFIKIRRKHAEIYTRELKKLSPVITPYEKPNVKHPYHLYPILVEGYDKATFVEKMKEFGIGCSVHYIPLHLHPFYKNALGFKEGDFPHAEQVSAKEVSLPLYPKMTEQDVWNVISSVKQVLSTMP